MEKKKCEVVNSVYASGKICTASQYCAAAWATRSKILPLLDRNMKLLFPLTGVINVKISQIKE
jgi:hypothetical protein